MLHWIPTDHKYSDSLFSRCGQNAKVNSAKTLDVTPTNPSIQQIERELVVEYLSHSLVYLCNKLARFFGEVFECDSGFGQN